MRLHTSSNNAVNVLHILSSLEAGGLERLLVDLVAGITRNNSGANITVIVMNNLIDPSLKEELTRNCRQVYFFNRQEGNKNIKYLFWILRIIRKHNIKVIHAHNYGSKIWASLCKILKPSIMLVFTTHDTLIDIKGISWYLLFLHRFLADCNVAISKAVLNIYEKYKFKNPFLIYNGINLGRFKVRQFIAGNNSEALRIINIARVDHKIKGQDILLKALLQLKERGCEFFCTFAGQNDGYCRKSYENLIQLVDGYGLKSETVFLGSRDDVPDLLLESDVFVLPSRYEGLGLAALEAMAAGIPVIASNTGGLSELITHGYNGLLFENENPADLADKIVELASNLELAEKLRVNGLEFVKGFNVERMYEKYTDLYFSLQQTRRRGKSEY